jgi:hypothetical protein
MSRLRVRGVLVRAAAVQAGRPRGRASGAELSRSGLAVVAEAEV